MKSIKFFLLINIGLCFCSCKKYLDIVPDNVATIENAFSLPSTAERYLFTCYSFMPNDGAIFNPAFTAGDEIWFPAASSLSIADYGPLIATGQQNKINPVLNYWDGGSNASPLFQALRNCNIFLENIDNVPGMQLEQKRQWIAEVKFLKAYYHFYLIRMYGPIPLIRENLSVSSELDILKVKREPVDKCFDYLIELIDEAIPDLPPNVVALATDLGRVNQLVAMSMKAKILVTAASPLFNGNESYAGFKNKDGEVLINPVKDNTKWERAAQACKEAIDACHEFGRQLHYYPGSAQYDLSEETKTQMSIRSSVTDKINTEIIWSNTNSLAGELQREYTPKALDPAYPTNQNTKGNFAPPIKIAEQFYSKNGLPINEDKTYDYNGRYSLRVANTGDKYNLQPGYTTAGLHFDREPRFYASLAFDGGIWYGQGRYDDINSWIIQGKIGQINAIVSVKRYSVTGYWVKKMVHFQNIIGSSSSYTIEAYPFPIIRLADLYLLYAEAVNESSGPGDEAYTYINLVRKRAGLKSVESSWMQFSTQPAKFQNQNGLREIIQQERLNELAFEGQRFWDLRRWKKAESVLNQNIYGWDIHQSEAKFYYRPKLLAKQTFLPKDYFWPIRENNLLINNNLVQNPGW